VTRFNKHSFSNIQNTIKNNDSLEKIEIDVVGKIKLLQVAAKRVFGSVSELVAFIEVGDVFGQCHLYCQNTNLF
jgi:uncharacterized protein (DUF111 family)